MLASLVALGGAAGCEWVPDEVNPARLFRDEEPRAGTADEEFPNLATVPDKPRPASSPEEIREVTEGLIADREKAAYTDEFLRNNPGEEVDFSASPKASAAAAAGEAAPDEDPSSTASIVEAAPAPEVTAEPMPVDEPDQAPVEEVVLDDAAGASNDAVAGASNDAVDVATSEEAVDVAASAPSDEAAPGNSTSEVFFAGRSTALDDRALLTIRSLAYELAQRSGTLRILTWAGAADSPDGGDLAEQRAIAVAEGLLALGVSGQRISALVMKGPDPEGGSLVPPAGRASITLRK